MHRHRLARHAAIVAASLAAVVTAAWTFAGQPCGCTGTAGCPQCMPACKATWNEAKKPGKPKYSLECEYACARRRDSWHAPAPECRCSPPCGRVYVKKKLFKEAGEEKVERAPKYEVVTAPATCADDRRSCWDILCGWFCQ